MATPSKNKGSRKLSSLFLRRSPKEASPAPSLPQSSMPNLRRLSMVSRSPGPKPKATLSKSASIPNLSSSSAGVSHGANGPMPPPSSTMPLSPLAPPPALVGNGPARPSSRESAYSTTSSRAASRDSSKTRSSTHASTLRPRSAQTSTMRLPNGNRDPATLTKRGSWLVKKPVSEQAPAAQESKAWIAGLKDHVPYDLSPVLRGEKISELWSETADTFIYLFPPRSGKGPSFKIASSLLSASRALLNLSRNGDLSKQDTSPIPLDSRGPDEAGLPRSGLQSTKQGVDGHAFSTSPTGERSDSGSISSIRMRLANDFRDEDAEDRHLYMPLEINSVGLTASNGLTSDEQELLVLYRNFFAFLNGGALIATSRQSSLFAVFLGIGSILTRFGFSNLDGSTFGEVVSSSFTRYSNELRLLDIRTSREKTIEAIVLGEKMKAWGLYNEGFVHGAGKLSHIKGLNSRTYDQISPVTRNRLERAAIDLEGRIRTIETKLEDFDFPSMFSGIANSQMAVEARLVRFKAWKTAFFNMRKQVVTHYRQRYGAWPPKAKSKKNTFEESGLNRLLLRDVYEDFTDLYDMLADRTQLTNRTIDMVAPDDDVDFNDAIESITHAIRRVESEYDRSTPPVQPPVPFDTPLFPSLSTSFNGSDVKDVAKDPARRLHDNQVNQLLLGSYNRESMKATPFLEDFLRHERRAGHNSTIDDIVDTRCGQWLFMYAVLQSLPMLVVDARDIQFSQGVEYFLCVPPRGGRPWIKEDTSQSRNWYNVASGGGIVSLPADAIDHSVEGIYRRSHCWTVAAKWASVSDAMSPATQMSLGATFPPPPIVGGPRLTTTQISSVNNSDGYNSVHSVHSINSQSPVLPPSRAPSSLHSYNDNAVTTTGNSSPALAASTSSIRPVSHLNPLNTAENRMSHNFSFGLEALPLPRGFAPDGSTTGGRPLSLHDPMKTFDSILGLEKGSESGKKKKKKESR